MPTTARTPLGEVKTYKISRDENQLLDVTKEKIEGRSAITAPKDGSTGRKAGISDLRRDVSGGQSVERLDLIRVAHQDTSESGTET